MTHRFYTFLSDTEAQLLDSIIAHRAPQLVGTFDTEKWDQLADESKSSIADKTIDVLNDEFMNHLDSNWEPTQYAKSVQGVLNKINEHRIPVNDRVRQSNE